MGLSNLFDKTGKKSGQSRHLVEKKNPNLPDKPGKDEKKSLTDVQRRQNELEKRQNPVYNEAYVPYRDPVETEENVVKNRHYERVSKFYRIAKWCALAVFFVYAAAMLLIFRDEITIENFRYLMRNVDFGMDTAVVLENDIIYSASEQNRFTDFRDYLALYNGKQLLVYDTGGKVALSEELNYASPAAAASKKYLLMYDKSSGAYSVYSYFTKEMSETLEYPITHASMSDSGVYAIATRSRDYSGVVYIYNSGFDLINRIMKNKSISAMDLNDDGSELLVCSYYIDDLGRNMTELTILPTRSNESKLNLSLEDTAVYSCSYLEGGGFVLVCAEGLRFYNSDGNLINRFAYNGMNVIKYMIGDSGAAVIYLREYDDSACFVEQFDAKGNSLFKNEASSDIKDAILSKDSVYLLYGDKLVITNSKGSSQISVAASPEPVKVICTEKDIFVCTTTSAIILKSEDSSSK